MLLRDSLRENRKSKLLSMKGTFTAAIIVATTMTTKTSFWIVPCGNPEGLRQSGVLYAYCERWKRCTSDCTATNSEMLRTLSLASTLFFMIGGYWLLRSLKDPIVMALCQVQAIPKAKMLSVFVILAVISVYNYFLDSDIPRHRLFYVFGSFYFCVFMVIALLLMHPTIGLANEQPSQWQNLGWISYGSIEPFGFMVSFFWSFANSNFSLETAKASYGVMVAMAQVGSILGPALVHHFSKPFGVAKLYMVGTLCMLLLQGTMYLYISTYGATERNATTAKPKKKQGAGVLEGLHLFQKHNYVKGNLP